jgi:hypothetical protein
LLALEPSVPNDKVDDFVDTAKKWLKDARRYVEKVEDGKIKDPAVITLQNKEIAKLIRKLKNSNKNQAAVVKF